MTNEIPDDVVERANTLFHLTVIATEDEAYAMRAALRVAVEWALEEAAKKFDIGSVPTTCSDVAREIRSWKP